MAFLFGSFDTKYSSRGDIFWYLVVVFGFTINFYKGVSKQRNKDILKFVTFLLLLVLYGLQTIFYVLVYMIVRDFSLSEEVTWSVSVYLSQFIYDQNVIIKRSWDKLQLNFECCGANSYVDWARIFTNEVPTSCCKIDTPGCGNISLSLDAINQGGCAKPFVSHVYDQIKLQTVYFLIFLLIVGIANLLFVVQFAKSLMLVVYRNVLRKKGQKETDHKKTSVMLLTPTNSEEPITEEAVKDFVDADNMAKKLESNSQISLHYSDNETDKDFVDADNMEKKLESTSQVTLYYSDNETDNV